MPSSYILSIDQGTTGTRALAVDKKGFIKGKSYKEFRQYFPQPGWVEHNPLEIFQSTLAVVKQLFATTGIRPSQIAAIGITNQRETTILWDKVSGRPLYNAIVWQDRRTSDICSHFKKQGLEKVFRNKTGLLLDPYFSGTKLKWLLDEVKTARRKASAGKALFGTVDTWLLWNLTGRKEHATDYSNASRTLLFNIRTKKWDSELLKILNIPAACLPQTKPSASLFGKTAKIGPLPEGIPVYGMAGDQQAALFGQGCYEAGTLKNTYGTGCFVVLNTGKKCVLSQHGLLTTLACDRHGRPAFALEGSVFIAGAAIQWIRDGLKFIKKAAETEKIAASLKDTGGVYLVPAFVGLGAPYWDSRARGAILGITRGTTRGHIIKAALESIAYQTTDVVATMKKESRLGIPELKVDGGATQNAYLMQFQADLLGLKIKKSPIVESTAWGAAKLAGIGSGFWRNVNDVDKKLRYRVFNPRLSPGRKNQLYSGWLDSVHRVLTAL